MSVIQLMADLGRLGIRLRVHGDRLLFSPKSAVTPRLAARIKEYKSELLELQRSSDSTGEERPKSGLQAQFPPSVKEALELADAEWAHDDQAREERIAVALEGSGYDPRMCVRCGSLDRVEVEIHEGQSTRIDCAECGRFVDFNRWRCS